MNHGLACVLRGRLEVAGRMQFGSLCDVARRRDHLVFDIRPEMVIRRGVYKRKLDSNAI